VQKGKFAACAFALDKQLKRVDFPTFGRPTIPHFKDIFKGEKELFGYNNNTLLDKKNSVHFIESTPY
jgi:hypothetical protein